MRHSKILLWPLSLLYGLVVSTRNFFFDIGLLKSKSFKVPVICVGNITVGGTGKTPHTELLIAELKKKFRVACLSRGYKRKSSGFILATANSTVEQLGDEPFQIHSKFPDILMACDGDRVRGINKLLTLENPPEVIILDDAFQHRYVQADKNIVLIDYNHPVFEDTLLPAGRLRESINGLKRGDYLIVTKCPENLQPIEQRVLHKHLKIKPYQQLYFTRLQYGKIHHLAGAIVPFKPESDAQILCVTGIAQPTPYIKYLKTFTPYITELRYPDHHHFNTKDIQEIETLFSDMNSEKKYIFTTEKDAVRLQACDLPQEVFSACYYIPVVPVFLKDQELFLTEISEYVRKNQA